MFDGTLVFKERKNKMVDRLIYHSFFRFGFNVFCKREKRILDVFVLLGAGFHELHAVFERQLFASLLVHLSFVVHVAFIADEHAFHVGRRVLLDVSYPISYAIEWLLTRYVIHEQYAHGTAIIGRRYRSKPLLTCRVPKLAKFIFNTHFYFIFVQI